MTTENATSVTVDDDRFEVADGNLKLKAGMTLDFESDTSPIDVTITASGDGDSATHTVTVSITDLNEAPTISVADGTTPDGMDATSTVAENMMGALLGEITLGDPDAGQMHTLATSDPKFVTKQDAEGGWWLALADDASLNFEDGAEVIVTVTVTDDGDPAMSASVDVTITVTNVNEAPSLEAADGAVDENAAGAMVGAVTVSDPDAGDTHTYEVSDDRFEVADGMLKLKDGMMLDSEMETSAIMVMITVTDAGGMTDTADVMVTVNDVNEAAEVDGKVKDAVFVGGQENSMEVDLKALFSDPDGDGLNYRLSDNAPDWLELSVTIKGSGDDQTITGTISGTPPSSDITADNVSIIASDGGGLEAHAHFDVIVDEENDAPTRLELRETDDEGVTERVTAVEIAENATGVVLGNLVLDDPDDARHPHGQHTYSFTVDGEADSRFEVTDDGQLKLKDDASLDHEDGATIRLTVTATDMSVGDDDSNQESISRVITITVGDEDSGPTEGPSVVASVEVGNVWTTVDEDLDEDDVDEGDWLSDTPKNLSKAFEDDDGDTLTYSLGSGAPRWLNIDEDTGKLTNKEGMLPNRGVYEVTIIASDDDGNSDEIEIKIAVAISDEGDEDNDEPDIRNVNEFDYLEGSHDDPGADLKVASFEVRDEDIEIDPHPYGLLKVEFTAHQDPGDGSDPVDVTNAFKIVKVGDDGNDTAEYEIHHKTEAELAMGADGDDEDDKPDVDKDGNVIPVKPIDYENGDEIDFEITVKDMDGEGDPDDRGISVDVDNAPDEKPAFQGIAGATRKVMEMETTINVDQDQARTVWVLQLQELWEDADTDDDDLEFGDIDESGLPSWVKVYGPDQWEDIHENRRYDVEEEDGDDVAGLRDRDMVVVIVVDRSKAPTNASRDGASFKISAQDEEGNSATETIKLSITDTNVDPTDEDKEKIVSISGGDPNDDDEVTGTGNLTMTFNDNLDPDIAGGQQPYLVLYTWMVPTGLEDDASTMDVDESVSVHSVSASPQPLPLGEGMPGMMTRIEAYLDGTITAKVEVFEEDPATGGITVAQEYTATVDVASAADAPVTPTPPTSVSFGDITTDTSGVMVTITATGEAAEAGTARLEASSDGRSGWITVDSSLANTGTATAPVSVDVTLDVDADGDGSAGDGGGLYYRVVYVYEDEDGDDAEVASNVIQLGNNPVSNTNDALVEPADIALIVPSPVASGGTVRVNNLTATVEVQWQVGEDGPDANTDIDANEWTDLDGETGLTLRLTDDHAGKSVRAKLTHKGDEDNPSHVTWVDYSAVAAVTELSTAQNNTPARTQATYEIRVNPDMNDGTEGTETGNVANLFFDADGDSLTYSLVGDLATTNVQPGRMVYRSDNDDQILTLDSKTGAITYYTKNTMAHDDDDTDTDGDGGGNLLRVSVQASDGKPDTADDTTDDVTIEVRVNVAPTAINLSGTAIQSDPDEDATPSGISFEETKEYGGADSITLDVQDLNLNTDLFGTHDLKVERKKADGSFVADGRFELARVTGDDKSMWTLSVKEDAEFDYEHADNPMGVITLKVTATDKGGKSTVGYLSVTLTNVDDGDDTNGTGNDDVTDPQYEEPDTSGAGSGGIMTTGAGAGDDDDGAGDPPGDGGLWVDEDLLNDFVISIEDIDIA